MRSDRTRVRALPRSALAGWPGWAVAAAFVVLAAGISAAAFFFYRHQQAASRSRVREQLASIADLKVAQVERWYRGMLANANYFRESGAVAHLARDFLMAPTSIDDRGRLRQWLEAVRRNLGVHRIVLLDTNGESRAADPSEAPWIAPNEHQLVEQAVRERRTVANDLHRNQISDVVNFDIACPLYDGEVLVGTVLLEIVPEAFLFQQIETWPIPSQTGEAILFRREGDEVVYLNEARVRALGKLRIPITERQIASVRAVLGEQGFVEAFDYRGHPVYAELRAIPGPSWFLVVKIDRVEVDAPLRKEGTVLALTVGTLILAAGLLIGALWRYETDRMIRRELVERTRAEAEARAHARQQEAIAELGAMVLNGTVIRVLLQECARRVAHVLDLKLGVVWEIEPDRQSLIMRAGVGWREGLLGQARLAIGSSMVGYTLSRREPVVCADLRTETRFTPAPLLAEHRAVSGLCTVVGRAERPFGVLGAFDEAGHEFSPTDVNFMRGVANVLADGIERMATEAALRETSARLEQAQRIAKLGSYRLDLKTDLWRSSPLLDEMLGLSGGDVLREREAWFSLIHPDDQQEVRRHFTEDVLGQGRPFFLTYRVCRANDGIERWVEARGELTVDETGEFATVFGAMRDVTEQKTVELQLRASQQKLALHVERTPLAVIEWDLEFRVAAWNPAAESIFGYTVDEALGRSGKDLLVPKELHPAVETKWQQLLQREGGLRSTNENVTKHGKVILCEWYNTPLVDASGRTTAVASLVLEITERRRHEHEREELLRERERKNDELESMLYVASHDLRAPLINVQGFSQRLEKASLELTTMAGAANAAAATAAVERITKALHFIRISATKMDGLISGLLRVSRLGRMAFNPVQADMNRVMKQVIGTLEFHLQQAGAMVQAEMLPACVGDEGMLGQVLTNLIDNAIKYRASERPLRVTVTGRVEGSEVIYTVADTGIGIAAQHQQIIWEMFHRLDPTGPVTGEGLGLNVVRRIVDRHRGRVGLESTPGVGSTFWFSVPKST